MTLWPDHLTLLLKRIEFTAWKEVKFLEPNDYNHRTLQVLSIKRIQSGHNSSRILQIKGKSKTALKKTDLYQTTL